MVNKSVKAEKVLDTNKTLKTGIVSKNDKISKSDNLDIDTKYFKNAMIHTKGNNTLQNRIKDCIKKGLETFQTIVKTSKEKIFELDRTIRTNRALKKSNALKADKKLKGEKKYFTIMLVPHSSDKVKTIRISRLYTKLVFIIIILVTLSVHTLFRINDINNENTALKLSSVQLYNLPKDQKTLLSEKVEEINSLLEKEDNANINIAEFMDKYRDVVDKYVSGRIDSGLASRSGNRTRSSFAKDIEELREILTALSEVNKLKDENFIDLTETENKLRKYLDSLPDLWPVNGRVSSKFGYRLDPFTFRRSYHKGIDIAASYGTSIKASASGKVILAGSYNELGKTVIVDHGNGITTVYGHTSKVLVKKGQTVKKGAVIAKVGSSGRSTGSHLHFEIRINGEPIDPFKYLD